MLPIEAGTSEQGWVWSGAAVLAIAALVAVGAGAYASHEEQELSLSGETDLGDDLFGSAVAVDGDRAFIGAENTRRDAWLGIGAVYEYTWNGEEWYQSGRVTPPDGSAMGFGSSVALDGHTLLVGAQEARVEGTPGGAVYEYAWDGDSWEHQARISLGEVTEFGQRFGSGVALDGDVALIGAPGTELAGQAEAGEVWMYEKQGDEWVREEQIKLSIPEEEGHFGSSVALDGDVALVGAEGISGKVSEQGIVYEYRYDGDWTREASIQLDGAGQGDEFGSSVALDGDRALIGASEREVAGDESAGAVYLYGREAGAWEQQGEAITLGLPSPHDQFGTGVAFGGEGALIGAFGVEVEDETSAGAAYTFRLEGGGWTLERSHDIRGELREDTHFGEAVASSGERVLVASRIQNAAYAFAKDNEGAWVLEDKLTVDASVASVDLVDGTAVLGVPSEEADGVTKAGAAYIFVHDGFGAWNEQARIPNPDPQVWGLFGTSVSLGEDRALIGFEEAEVDGQDGAGAVYVFERSSTGTWTEQARIANPNPLDAYKFGKGVDLHSDTAIIGAYREAVEGHRWAGAAYVFADDGDGTWTQQARLVDPDPSENARFGEAVVSSDTWAIVASPGEQVQEIDEAGAVHVFSPTQQDGWAHHARLGNPEPAEGDRFGHTLALDGSTLLVGAEAEVEGATNAGKAYAFAEDGTGTWTRRDEVSHPHPEAGDDFGSALALEGTTVLVGAPDRDVGARSDVGSSYLFAADTLAASFTYEPASAIGPGDEVAFTDGSLGPVTSRTWSFGDGTTSTDPSPHRNFDAGAHEVCLEVNDEAGHADEACQTVEVLEDGESGTTESGEDDTSDSDASDASGETGGELSPSADADEVSPGEAVTFSAEGDDGSATVSWDFGDGQAATGSPVEHAFDEPGTYTVTMTTEDENGETTVQSIQVEVTEDGFDGIWLLAIAAGLIVVGVGVWRRGSDDEEQRPVGGPGRSTVPADEVGSSAGTCAECGAGMPEEADFCPACGAQATPGEGATCPDCEATVPPGSSFCTSCGANLQG